jgi:hypothetical protein
MRDIKGNELSAEQRLAELAHGFDRWGLAPEAREMRRRSRDAVILRLKIVVGVDIDDQLFRQTGDHSWRNSCRR